MKRRAFTAAMVAAALSAPRSATAQQTPNEPEPGRGDGNERDRFGRVELRIGRQVVVPVRILLIDRSSGKTFGVDLNGQFPIQDENSLGLFTPTMARLFAGGERIGEVRLAGRTLLAVSDLPLMPGNLHIQSGDISYKIDAARSGRYVEARLPQLGTIPLVGQLFRSKTTSNSRRSLLVFVHPEIIRP